MIKFLVRTLFATLSVTVFLNLFASVALAQRSYEPTTESLSKHEVPDWFKDAKLGIFIHWGAYSVPGLCTTNWGTEQSRCRAWLGILV
ncbi:hypothetical protein NIES21_40390 [Anabaenopsis circularis NIES-21]|uniref:Glycoside hydrolase family 29 N-terminal domain-containing protein n=1 Tax=Anabaenopsis circularis NIES-21 TaxID=1085406 RepID=A0A1Z4GL30_9CYAN|nr:hypothetical protein NIES21_40390 [Anabaenopsis circularis NIES-21]